MHHKKSGVMHKGQFSKKTWQRITHSGRSVFLARNPYAMGCIDARKGIFNTILTASWQRMQSFTEESHWIRVYRRDHRRLGVRHDVSSVEDQSQYFYWRSTWSRGRKVITNKKKAPNEMTYNMDFTALYSGQIFLILLANNFPILRLRIVGGLIKNRGLATFP